MAAKKVLNTALTEPLKNGFVWKDNYPTALVRDNGSTCNVSLLLPYDILKARPWYSAVFNGFINATDWGKAEAASLIKVWQARAFGAQLDQRDLDVVTEKLLPFTESAGITSQQLAAWDRLFLWQVVTDTTTKFHHLDDELPGPYTSYSYQYKETDFNGFVEYLRKAGFLYCFERVESSSLVRDHQTGYRGTFRKPPSGTAFLTKAEASAVKTSDLLDIDYVNRGTVCTKALRIALDSNDKPYIEHTWVFDVFTDPIEKSCTFGRSAFYVNKRFMSEQDIWLFSRTSEARRPHPREGAPIEELFDEYACLNVRGEVSSRAAINAALLSLGVKGQTLFSVISSPIMAILVNGEDIVEEVEKLERVTGFPNKSQLRRGYRDELPLISNGVLIECGFSKTSQHRPKYSSYWLASANTIPKDEIKPFGE